MCGIMDLLHKKTLGSVRQQVWREIVEWLRGPTFSYCAKSIDNRYVIVGFFE